MTTIIILSIVYLVSCFSTWKLLGICYSSKGRWSNIHPGGADMFVTFTPILNTGMAISLFVMSPYRDDNRFDKFFNVKK